MILNNSWFFTIFRSRHFSGAWFSTVLPHGSFFLFQNTLILIRIPNEKQAIWVLLTYFLTIFCAKDFLLHRLFLDIRAHVTRILLKTTYNGKLLNHHIKYIMERFRLMMKDSKRLLYLYSTSFFRTGFFDKFLALFCCH